MADVLPQVLGVDPDVPPARAEYSSPYDRGYDWTDDEGTYR
jgi:hypothetical protein